MERYSGSVALFGMMFFFIAYQAFAQTDLSFIDAHFSDFLERVVPTEDRAEFTHFFPAFSKKINDQERDKQKIFQSELFTKALHSLKQNKKPWYESIDVCVQESKNCDTDGEVEVDLKKIQLFLFRYGIYIAFLESKTQRALPEFIKQEFREFAELVVPEKQRDVFFRYYTKSMEEVTKAGGPMKEATLAYLENRALEALKFERADWYKAIKTSLKKKNKLVQQFLHRYGAYQEFLEIRALSGDAESEGPGIFAQIGSFFSNLGATIGGWFGFGQIKAS